MNDCIAELYDYICEETNFGRDDPEYQRFVQAYMEIEDEVKEKIGVDLLTKYQSAEHDLIRRQDLAVFTQTLRCGHRFMLELLGD